MANVPIESFGNVVPDDLARVLVVAGLSGPIIGTSLLPKNADRIAFDNVASGLTATDVQAAIDEIVAGLGTASAEDYEEGTFSPTFTFDTPGDLSNIYSTQSGKYSRIGDVCNFQITLVTVPTFTTASGDLRIASLPFTSAATPEANFCMGRATQVGMTYRNNNQYLAGYIAAVDTAGYRLIALGPTTPSVGQAQNTSNIVSGNQIRLNLGGFYYT